MRNKRILIEQFISKVKDLKPCPENEENALRLETLQKISEYCQLTRMPFDTLSKTDIFFMIKANWDPKEASSLLREYIACHPKYPHENLTDLFKSPLLRFDWEM